jgi:uncharacterized protein YcsI (UPF0317 family)
VRRDDLASFVVGCSFSFEEALMAEASNCATSRAASATTEVIGEGVQENAPQGRTKVGQLSALAAVRMVGYGRGG